jgi:carboxypeptidase Taq
METYMPPRSIGMKSEQLALLSVMSHKMRTDPEIGKLLKPAKSVAKGIVEQRNLYLMQKGYDESTKMPEKLVEQLAKQQAIATSAWKSAKAAKNFSIFKPELEKMVELNREVADILMKVNKAKTPYDALIDSFEPKMTADAIDLVFADLRKDLMSLIERCQSAKKPDTSILRVTVPTGAQKDISTMLAQALGYDVTSPNSGGRIDETEHPFTTGMYDDVRITTHYHQDNFTDSVFSVLHETGHALYEQGMNPTWKFQPVGTACSYGIHESQSRFMENIVGRSKEFWTYQLPKIKDIASPSLDDLELDQFMRAVNIVNPSKIRIEADEVTYNLHVIIRFQIEKGLFNGKINVSELPQIWNEMYEEYLDVKIENDSEGVLQDTHWASGLFGYFPSYSLGNIYSGQIFSKISRDQPDWKAKLSVGDLSGIKSWLSQNVYMNANLYDPADLIKKITGTGLNAKPFVNYLRAKYGELYGF